MPTPPTSRPLLAAATIALTALVALTALISLTIMTVLPTAAEAACVCRCLDGKAKAICSSGTDIPPLCNATACPMTTPKRTPQDVRQTPPPVKPGCTNRQVYDPKTGKHEWAQICQ